MSAQRRTSLPEVAYLVYLSPSGSSGVIVLGGCCPTGSGSCFNVVVLVLLVDATFNYLYLSVLTWCGFYRHTLCFRFIQLPTLVAYEFPVGEAKITNLFAVCLYASDFPSQPMEYACCRVHL